AGVKIDDDVPDRAHRAADKLNLRMRRRLKMHAAQGASARIVRRRMLNEARLEPMRFEFTLAEAARKPAAAVADRLALDQPCAVGPGLGEQHANSRDAACTANRAP